MELADVNVLVQTIRADGVHHPAALRWLQSVTAAAEPYAVSELVLSSFVRIVTNRRIFSAPTPLTTALDFANAHRSHLNAIVVAPGATHWATFDALCREVGAIDNLILDAYLAALAIEANCTFVTLDRGFARFPGLLWKRPS